MMDALEKAGEKQAKAAVALVFFAGLRPGEAHGARWEDYDGKRLSVHRSVWRVWTTAPKTESSAKPVPIIEPLKSILAALHEADGNPAVGPILRGPSGKRYPVAWLVCVSKGSWHNRSQSLKFACSQGSLAPLKRQYNRTALHQGCAGKHTPSNEAIGSTVHRLCNSRRNQTKLSS
jgi:integrase